MDDYKHKSADSMVFCISPHLSNTLNQESALLCLLPKTSIILRFYFDLRFYLKGFNAVGMQLESGELESLRIPNSLRHFHQFYS